VWALTFGLTVMADLTVAVEVGMALAALLYIHRVTDTTVVLPVTQDYIDDGRVHTLQDHDVPDDVAILRIQGPFLFGMTDKLADATADISALPAIVILRLRNMTAIDATGLHAFEQLNDRLQASGRSLILCGARQQPAALLHQADLLTPNETEFAALLARHAGDRVDADVIATLDVARLHALAAADLVAEDQLGRPRLGPEIAARLDVMSWLTTGTSTVPAPLLAAVAHGELLALSAFGSADGVVARAVGRLVTISTGLDPHGLGVPEVFWMRRAADYRDAARGFAAGTEDGLARWLVLHCRALQEGAREALGIADMKDQGGAV